MRKIIALALVLILVLFAGCNDDTPYDNADIEDAYYKGYSEGLSESVVYEDAYQDGYDEGYSDGWNAGYDSCMGEESEPNSAPRSVPEAQGHFFITRTGKCFHAPGCQYEPYAWYKTREDAIADGYSPCSKCNP